VCTSIVGTRRKFWFNVRHPRYDDEALKSRPDHERLRLLAEVGFAEDREYETREALSDEEMRAMADVVDFQSHTRFHVNLPRAMTVRSAEEIAWSKKELEARLGHVVYALAYPDNDYSSREMMLLKESGYKFGLCGDGYYNALDNDVWALRRLSVRDASSVDEAMVRASGLWAFIHKLFFGQKHGFKSTSA
jgi:hypothetical protein